MFTKDKITEIFCVVDDFCKFFDTMMAKYTIKAVHKRKYHRSFAMSKAEIMLIMILFHDSGYRCLKHFYLDKVCVAIRESKSARRSKVSHSEVNVLWDGSSDSSCT